MGISTLIAEENARPGTEAWQVAAGDPLRIEGYASAASVTAGDVLVVYVTCEPVVEEFSIAYFRMGWYGGLGGRLVHEVNGLGPVLQSVPEMDASRWMAECRWTPSDAFQIPVDWASGVYMAVLTTHHARSADKRCAYVPFVVRDDFHPHQIVYQMPFATYHAYSAWPRQGTRYWNAGITCGNLYGASGPDASTRSYAVSFNRPFAQNWGSGEWHLLWHRRHRGRAQAVDSKGGG